MRLTELLGVGKDGVNVLYGQAEPIGDFVIGKTRIVVLDDVIGRHAEVPHSWFAALLIGVALDNRAS